MRSMLYMYTDFFNSNYMYTLLLSLQYVKQAYKLCMQTYL